MRHIVSALLLAATTATPLLAQPPADTGQGRRELRQDGRETDRDRGAGQDRAGTRGDAARSDFDENRRRQREFFQDRAEYRSTGRDDGRDYRDDRRDDRRDGRRDDFRDGRGRAGGGWNEGWRQDRRYDWQRYRQSNRQAYRLPRYYGPGGGYRRYGAGFRIGAPFYSRRYWINDPYAYRLPPIYGPYRWVRYYDDVLLVDITSGLIRDTIYDFFD